MLDDIGFDWESRQRVNAEAKWNKYYKYAKEYYKEYGNLLVPIRYITKDGALLGRWIVNQRRIKRGALNSVIQYDVNRIKMLEDIGMVWYAKLEFSWDDYCNALVAYRKEHGHLYMPKDYIYGAIPLANWIKLQRTKRNHELLSDEEIAKLDIIGFPWDYLYQRWLAYYLEAKRYFEENGNMDIPKDYICVYGTKLRLWWNEQRRRCNLYPEKLSDKQITMLKEIGMKC